VIANTRAIHATAIIIPFTVNRTRGNRMEGASKKGRMGSMADRRS
jgi:hypothetical protein